LYDLQSDPDEVNNLAASASHQAILARLRQAQQNKAREIRDLGFLPEGERFTRQPGAAPYDLGHDHTRYPFERIFAAAELASSLKPDAIPVLKELLADRDSAVRYWGAMGMLMRGATALPAARPELTAALQDSSPFVRIAAAEVLGQFGTPAELAVVLPVLTELAHWGRHDVFTVMAALHAIEALGPKATAAKAAIFALPAEGPSPHSRYVAYVPRLLARLKTLYGGPDSPSEPAPKAKRRNKKAD
jgi:uncharacterized sulfatase